MDAFNTPAKPPSAKELLLQVIAGTRASLAMADAALRHDWPEVARLKDAGADPLHRDKAALKELTASDAIPVADILEKTDPFPYPPLMVYTLARAAERGNLATVAHIIAKNPAPEMLNHGLCAALLAKQPAAADLLLAAIPEDQLRDNALFGLLVARPADYGRITQARTAPPDYLMHFLNACNVKDAAAIDLALDRMLSNREDTRRRIQWADMDFMDMGGSAVHEMTAHVFESGHLPAIGKFIDNFRDDLMPDFLLLHVALMVAGPQPGVFSFIIDKLNADFGALQAIVAHSATPDRRPAARCLLEKFPEQVKEDSYGVLRAFAGGDTPQEFFDALNAGVPLPKNEFEMARLFAAAIQAKNDVVAAHLEAAIGKPTPGQLAELQKSHDTDVIFRAAQIGGDWHFRDDALFWRAAAEGRRDILDAMPDARVPLQAPMTYQLENALNRAIETKDQALIDEILARTPWTDELRDAAAGTFMASPQYLPLLDKLGYAARPLEDGDMHDIMRGQGKEALAWLLARGFTMDDEAAAAALEIAVKQNEREAVEYLLGSGVTMTEAPRMATMVELYAAPGTMNLLEKWLRRDDVAPAGDLPARVAAALPDAALDLGVEAAYAGVFAGVARKIAEAADGFDPAALCRTKDPLGNSILDILGAHGKLNDILVPELWRDRDAVSFIRENAPPCYHGQCDFNGLKAALDQLRLKDLGRRARIGLKGP